MTPPFTQGRLTTARFEFVFISNLIYKDNYEIIHERTQCKIENN